MPKVFISHSTRDLPFVESRIVGPLNAHGIGTWHASEDIRPPDYWERAILRALEDCDWFLLVMSPRSADSEWVKDEVNWAVCNRENRIVSVLVEACEPIDFHMRLPRIQYIDFRGHVGRATERLLAVLGVGSSGRGSSDGTATSPGWRVICTPGPRIVAPDGEERAIRPTGPGSRASPARGLDTHIVLLQLERIARACRDEVEARRSPDQRHADAARRLVAVESEGIVLQSVIDLVRMLEYHSLFDIPRVLDRFASLFHYRWKDETTLAAWTDFAMLEVAELDWCPFRVRLGGSMRS